MIHKKSLIFIAGHNGMVGSAIKRKLIEKSRKWVFFKSCQKKIKLIHYLLSRTLKMKLRKLKSFTNF